MLNFIKMEFLKLKNTKIFFLSLLSSIAPAFFIYLGLTGKKISVDVITFKYVLLQTNLYFLGIFSIFILTIFVSYMFSREYSEHTIKSILPTPISRVKYLVGKNIAFLIWILVLCSIAIFAGMLVSFLMGAKGFSVMICLEWYFRTLFGGFLVFLVMSPLMFLAMYMKNMVPAMIAAAILTFGNLFAYGHKELIFYPWMLPPVISSGEIIQYTSQLYIPGLTIVITFLIGFSLAYLTFIKKDIRL